MGLFFAPFSDFWFLAQWVASEGETVIPLHAC
jgi:hypothetical protein